MKFVLLFGPQAVGKMTVGQELEKTTGLKLFHNHMTIELVAPFFSYGSAEGKRLVGLFRKEIFEAVSKSDLSGIIFTYVWAFDQQSDWDYVHEVCSLFENRGAEICFAELFAPVDIRLERNKTPNRLNCKPTKRNLEFTERDILKSMEKYRLNSLPGEIVRENYIKINNSGLSPEETAAIIKERFFL